MSDARVERERGRPTSLPIHSERMGAPGVQHETTALKATERNGRAVLGKLEAEVMTVVWASGECSVRQVMSRLPERTAYTTVMTTLVRLFEKGLLGRRRVERKFLYSARITQATWQYRAALDAAEQFLATPNVSRAMLASALWRAISERDPGLLAELERLLQRRRWEERCGVCS